MSVNMRFPKVRVRYTVKKCVFWFLCVSYQLQIDFDLLNIKLQHHVAFNIIAKNVILTVESHGGSGDNLNLETLDVSKIDNK